MEKLKGTAVLKKLAWWGMELMTQFVPGALGTSLS
jgi:hypothetical protein